MLAPDPYQPRKLCMTEAQGWTEGSRNWPFSGFSLSSVSKTVDSQAIQAEPDCPTSSVYRQGNSGQKKQGLLASLPSDVCFLGLANHLVTTARRLRAVR